MIWSLDGNISPIERNSLIRWVCCYGHLEVAQWLFSLTGTIHPIARIEAFAWSCDKNHLVIANWLWSLEGDTNPMDPEEAFVWCCGGGYLKACQNTASLFNALPCKALVVGPSSWH